LGRLRDSDPQPAKSGKNAPKLTWKPIIRESSPSQPSQQPETIFENRLFQEQLSNSVTGGRLVQCIDTTLCAAWSGAVYRFHNH
ncbi:hypothetical protein ACFW4D_11640, partial [Paenibacillus lactis]|uniref:hypothetical protein n=1 Tax=Paenibacillus lactis TaxID=228574 RepID=UPI0036B995C2